MENQIGVYQYYWKPLINDEYTQTHKYEIVKNLNINEEVYVEVYFSLYKEYEKSNNGMSIPEIVGFHDNIKFDIKEEFKYWIPNKFYSFHKILTTMVKNNSIVLSLLHSDLYYKYSENGIYINIIPIKYKNDYIFNKPIINAQPIYIGNDETINNNKKDPIDILCELYKITIERFKTLFKSDIGKIYINELAEIYNSDDLIDIKNCRYYGISKIYLDNVTDNNITEISVANYLIKYNLDIKNDLIYKFLKDKYSIDKKIDKNDLIFKLRNIVYQSVFTYNNGVGLFTYNNGVAPFKEYEINVMLIFHIFNYIKEPYCQVSQIIYLYLLSLFNIISRPVALAYIDNEEILRSHASIEVYSNNKYIISDPHFAMSIKNKENEYLSFKELHKLYSNKDCNNIIKEMSCEKLSSQAVFPSDHSLTIYEGLMNNIILKDECYILDNNDVIKYYIKYFQDLYHSDIYSFSINS